MSAPPVATPVRDPWTVKTGPPSKADIRKEI